MAEADVRMIVRTFVAVVLTVSTWPRLQAQPATPTFQVASVRVQTED